MFVFMKYILMSVADLSLFLLSFLANQLIYLPVFFLFFFLVRY